MDVLIESRDPAIAVDGPGFGVEVRQGRRNPQHSRDFAEALREAPWGEQFHDQDWINREAMGLIREQSS